MEPLTLNLWATCKNGIHLIHDGQTSAVIAAQGICYLLMNYFRPLLLQRLAVFCHIFGH